MNENHVQWPRIERYQTILVTRRHLHNRNDCNLFPATCAVWPSSHQNNSLLQAHPVGQPQVKARWKRLSRKNFRAQTTLSHHGKYKIDQHSTNTVFMSACLSAWLSILSIYLLIVPYVYKIALLVKCRYAVHTYWDYWCEQDAKHMSL